MNATEMLPTGRLKSDRPPARSNATVALGAYRRGWCAIFIGVVWAVVWSVPALAQDDGVQPTAIEGTIVFKDLPDLSNPSNSHRQWRIPSGTLSRQVPLPLTQMVVTFSREGGSAAQDTQDAKVILEGYQITPLTLAVRPGAKVTFTSNGPTPYTLKSVGRVGIEDIVLAKTGDSAEVVLDKPGRYVFQDPHLPSVLVYIVVADHLAASALTLNDRSKATFELASPPAGDYQLKTYLRGKLVDEREVKVSGSGTPPIEFLLTGEDLLEALR